jgi:hypothetical protein
MYTEQYITVLISLLILSLLIFVTNVNKLKLTDIPFSSFTLFAALGSSQSAFGLWQNTSRLSMIPVRERLRTSFLRLIPRLSNGHLFFVFSHSVIQTLQKVCPSLQLKGWVKTSWLENKYTKLVNNLVVDRARVTACRN